MYLTRTNIMLLSVLLMAIMALPVLLPDDASRRGSGQAAVVADNFPATGFADYDLLPAEMKQEMEELISQNPGQRFSFYYFTETDDINRHYYLEDDSRNEIVASMPVPFEQQDRLKLLDERLRESNSGFDIKYHEAYWQQSLDGKSYTRQLHRKIVYYIFPEEEADFRQMRVGIARDTTYRAGRPGRPTATDTKTYALHELDTPPVPVRGMDYFHHVIRKYLKEEMVYFNFYNMEGMVRAEFTVGAKAGSPQISEGFSTREHDRDEAYKLDGLIVKALNEPKVRWQRGQKHGKEVDVRVSMTFSFGFNKNGQLDLSMSDLQPASQFF